MGVTLPRSGHRLTSKQPFGTLSVLIALLLSATGLISAPTPAAAAATPQLSWSTPQLVDASGKPPSAISCPAESLCVAVDLGGSVLTSTDPGAATPSWATTSIDPGHELTSVSCASAAFCVAVDGTGEVLTSTNPAGASWTSAGDVDEGRRLTGVACPSTSLCVAVDESGDVLASMSPASASWTRVADATSGLVGVSCASISLCVAVDAAGDALTSTEPAKSTWGVRAIDAAPPLTAISCAPSGTCIAVGGAGEALASADPGAQSPTWSATAIAGSALDSVSCIASGLCVTVGEHGQADASEEPTAAIPAWSESSTNDAGEKLAGVSCVAGGLCVTIDASGRALTVRVPPPTVTPPAPAPVLLPPLVYPSPSITGTPAVGERLTCHPGTPSGASARLSYAWLRDLSAIPDASGSSYVVKGTDTGHHLQCQVTATNAGGSATARSAFVTVPVEAVPASVGETIVGKAAYKNGKISVPVTCSPHASGSCQIVLRLTVTETLSGSRIVAVAAHTSRGAHGRVASLRHLTVTLASIRARLAAGAHSTLTAVLNRTGRRLLASRRHLSAELAVSGTVIGGIEAQLAQQIVALGASSHSASTHAARRR